MVTTIGGLKVGERLIFGKYGVSNDNPHPVVWLKANLECNFITEHAIDYICFDATERSNERINIQYSGNGKYKWSNIFSFLNSENEQWYYPTHRADSPPDIRNVTRYAEYESHFGFLYHFEEYEIDSLIFDSIRVGGEDVSSLIRLPLMCEIVNDKRFKLFHKKGLRPKATEDMVQHRIGTGFHRNSYIDFWLADEAEFPDYANILCRDGSCYIIRATEQSGLRPVCRIREDTPVIMGEDGVYRVKPYTVHQNICTDAELFSLLGITPA